MLLSNPYLTEPYFVSSFITGLDEEIKQAVKLLKPINLMLAYEQARLEELHMEAILKRSRYVYKSSFNDQILGWKSSESITMSKTSSTQGNNSIDSFKGKQQYGPALSCLKVYVFRCGEKYQ